MSDGHHAFVQNSSDLANIFAAEFKTALTVVAKQLTIIIKCADSIRPIRVLGRNAEIIGQNVHVTLNQLSSNQQKFVMLEVEVPSGAEGENRDVASVDVSYQDIRTKKTDSLQNSVSVNFSKAKEDVLKNVNKPVMDSAAEQVVNEMSKEAVSLRDAGKMDEAKEALKQSGDYLKKNLASGLFSPKTQRLEEELRQDEEDLSDKDWNQKRKSLRERQFKREKQQQY